MKMGRLLSATIVLAASGGLSAASADTLRDALARAYRTNPSLTGARANLRAVDEGVPQAKALGRPTLGASVGVDKGYSDELLQDSRTTALSASATLSLPIFQGGLVGSSVRAAESRVEAGRASLRSTEADTFLDVVSAYMDVIRAQSVVDLNINQVKVLDTNLRAASDRFEVGDLTRTDVAQSQARLAGAQSSLVAAEGQLTVARENYLRVVGKSPEALEPPPPLPKLPETASAAVEVALSNNPDLLAAKASEKAADYDVKVARSDMLPRLSANATGNYNDYLGTLDNARIPGLVVDQRQKSAVLGVTASVPLYQGGLVASRVRQARALQSQALEQTVLIERQVVNQARAAYANLVTARAVKQSSEQAVEANRLALEGVRAENSVGTRDVLDVLNAEQELLNSQVTLVTAQRDEYVAGFALLVASGMGEARNLGLDGGPLYDPGLNYKRVRNSISDWSTGARPVVEATPTVGPPAP